MASAIDPLDQCLYLFLDAHIQLIGKGKRLVRTFAQADNLLCQFNRAFAALGPGIRQNRVDAHFPALFNEQVHFRLGIGREAVDCHYAGQLVHIRDVMHMAQQIGQALFQCCQIFRSQFLLALSAVHLERTDGGYDDNGTGHQTGHAALDIQELFRAQIRTEAGFRHGIVAEAQGHLRG